MIARLKIWAAAAGLLVVALAASWFGGRKMAQADAKAKQKAEELESYVSTRKRMDRVDVGDDPAVLRDWLRERGKQ